ncbi:hypothetical protein KB879_35910 (plasmid) [Cupriavidus sp. KK10]|uniref:hypothetical protein n=1 Tax=Cupriavidus sp. KK10 TaxID=1478019 RepID=UPI001BA530C6|nr:hypothetical protein [Cupriavidus sp. KK10]QUN31743.1 hypothetical protein KB879_35910 [Cupriavidus sp. KK10]
MSKTVKKRYLEALNRNLKKESAGRFDTLFVFYPLGAKPKDATLPADAQVLALMESVQARVFAEFENSAKFG